MWCRQPAGTPPKSQPIGDDLDPAVIQMVDAGDVQVCHPRVGGHPGTRFAANPSCCSLQWSPRLRRRPDCAQAERWSPKGSRVRRHRQERADNGKGRRSRRRSKRRKCSEEYVDSGPYGTMVKTRLAYGPLLDSRRAWLAGGNACWSSARKAWE